MNGRFDGKVVIVTGAAGGIGRATAVRFGQEGARVVLVDLPGAMLAAAVTAVGEAGGVPLAVEADVTRADWAKSHLARAVDRFGTVDCLVNNAGIEGAVAPMLEYPEDVFDRVIAVNLKGVWLGMKHVGEPENPRAPTQGPVLR